MEFFLPLILGVGLIALLVGGDDDGGNDEADVPPEPRSGTDGDDTVTLSSVADIFDGGDGDDSIDGGGGFDTIMGGDGADTINGAEGKDSIDGDSGDDVIYGGAWDDSIDGNQGFDTIFGGAGNDQIQGGFGKDLIDGGDGNDRINGENWDDTILGGAGDDDLSGATGNDVILGDAGSDQIEGDEGSDILAGGDGGDTVLGGSGDDLLIGGAFPLSDVESLEALSGDEELTEEARALLLGFKGGDGYYDKLVGGTGDDIFILADDADDATGGGGGDQDAFVVFSELGEALDGEGDQIGSFDDEPTLLEDQPGVLIRNFDPSEDVLVILNDGATDAPVLTFETGSIRLNPSSLEPVYAVRVFADGNLIASITTDVPPEDVQEVTTLQVI